MCHLDIKRLLGRENLNYSHFTIVQAYEMKRNLEYLVIEQNNYITTPVDYVNMYK